MAIKLSADKEPEILWKTSKVSEKKNGTPSWYNEYCGNKRRLYLWCLQLW